MTEPLAKPPRKNPVARTRQPTLPPGSRSRAAQSLGIPKRTLARRCQAWNLDREDSSR